MILVCRNIRYADIRGSSAGGEGSAHACVRYFEHEHMFITYFIGVWRFCVYV